MSDNRTTELLPCPFCGSNKAYPNIELGKHWVECRECTAESGDYRTKAEAIAAWNTRAELGSETCEWQLEHSGTLYDKWRCSKCGYLFVEPRTDQGYTDLEPNFCPNCGRKVVS